MKIVSPFDPFTHNGCVFEFQSKRMLFWRGVLQYCLGYEAPVSSKSFQNCVYAPFFDSALEGYDAAKSWLGGIEGFMDLPTILSRYYMNSDGLILGV